MKDHRIFHELFLFSLQLTFFFCVYRVHLVKEILYIPLLSAFDQIHGSPWRVEFVSIVCFCLILVPKLFCWRFGFTAYQLLKMFHTFVPVLKCYFIYVYLFIFNVDCIKILWAFFFFFFCFFAVILVYVARVFIERFLYFGGCESINVISMVLWCWLWKKYV